MKPRALQFLGAAIVFLAFAPAATRAAVGDVAQLASPSGCLAFSAVMNCGSLAGSGFAPTDVAVSPEVSGSVSSVYLGSPQGLVVLGRNTTTGVLSQLAGGAGCLNAAGSGGCTGRVGRSGVTSA
jgi:hypothetical protein